MEAVTNASLFLCSQEDVLLLRRPVETAENPGRIGLPGGIVEPLEDPLDVVVRETAAATGIKVGGVAVQLVYAQTNPDLIRERSVTRLFYTAATEAREPVGFDVQDVDSFWVPRWYVPTQLKHPAQRMAISYILRQKVLPSGDQLPERR